MPARLQTAPTGFGMVRLQTAPTGFGKDNLFVKPAHHAAEIFADFLNLQF